MRHVLVATHGRMAEGIKTSMEMISGPRENFTFINFYTDDKVDYEALIREYMEKPAEEDEILICTDMFFGSVSQMFVPYLKRKNVYMLTGINLPALLEVAFFEEALSKEVIEAFAKTGHQQLYRVDVDKLAEAKEEDPEDFF